VHPDAGSAAPRPPPEGDDDIGLGRRREPVAAGEGEQQVHRERPVGQGPRRGQLATDRRRTVDRDGAEPAGLRDGRGQLVTAEPATHPRLHDGHLDADALEH
jgi:hypothetical protein